MSEYDANQWLTQNAAPDPVDPLEQTQRMPVSHRRYRQCEARVQNWQALDEQIMQDQANAEVDRLVRKQGWAITVAEPSDLDRRARQSPRATLHYSGTTKP